VTVRGDDTINIGGLTQDHSTIVSQKQPLLWPSSVSTGAPNNCCMFSVEERQYKKEISLVNITDFSLQKDTRPKNILLTYWHLANFSHLYLSIPV